MKKMTCAELDGGCDTTFSGTTFEEIIDQHKKHSIEMIDKRDEAHLKAMQKMQELFSNTNEFKLWMDEKMKLFNDKTDD